jgi:hypothetical protein
MVTAVTVRERFHGGDRMTKLHAIKVLVGVVAVFALLAGTALAQSAVKANVMEVNRPVHSDVSRPLRDVKPIEPDFSEPHAKPLLLINPETAAATTLAQDGALQRDAGPLVAATVGLSFEGVGLGNGYGVNAAPPDTNGSIGRTHYVQWVNEAFAIFDRTGHQVYPATGGAAGNTLFSGFGGKCETTNDGDPIVLYDKAADRWLMSQFAVSGGSPYYQCIAISTTGDPTGTWYRYAYSFGTGFNDYPKFGVWPDAYYASYNIFNNGSTFAGSKACAYNRTAMLAGQAAPTQVCFATSTSYGGLLPADLDGSIAPPAGSPEYFVNFTSGKLNVWKLHVDWTNTASSTFTGPTALTVASFTTACSGGTCVPQLGTSQKLDSLADRLMYRFAYRRFADGTESLLVNHSVKVTGAKKTQTTSGLRWYELRLASGTPSVYQQGTFSPDMSYRWMGSIAMDKVGNIGIGYSKSSSAMNPAIFYTGRLATDALGTLQAEASAYLGAGSQTNTLSRWGDYSSLSVDPVDDCTMWFTTEYLASNGTFNWHTRVHTMKFPNCQ